MRAGRTLGAAWLVAVAWVVTGVAVGPAPGATAARAELIAERVTLANAAARLFGGSDADGGIGDWYLGNGIVEAIVDDAGPQTDLPPGVAPPPLQSEAGLTGGTLIDLALAGRDNDQLSQLFSVGGLSAANFVAYHALEAAVEGDTAVVRAHGTLGGFDGIAPEQLPVVTEYRLERGRAYLTIVSRVRNRGPVPAALLGGFLDVSPWTTRAIAPFSPLPGLGFRHFPLDVDDLFSSLEQPVYSIGPGNVSPADGVMDPQRGAPAGEVSYGLVGVRARLDPDGPDGPAPPVESPVDRLFGVSNVQATALGNVPLTFTLDPGAALSYERRLYVGGRNDVASAANPILAELAPRLGFATGTLAGDVDAADTGRVRATGVVTRVAGPAIAGLPGGSPITQFRTDAHGRFAGVVVPEGVYEIEVRAAERDPVQVRDVVVGAGAAVRVAVPALSALGALDVRVACGDGGRAPVKLTFVGRDGTPDPRFGWDVDVVEATAGGADQDLLPETFGGARAQGRWAFLRDGRAQLSLRPGRYEVFASRGPEYGIASGLVTIAPGATARLRLALPRTLATPKALSADFHLHSARSLDSSAGPESRVVSFAAEGVEVVVSTDHDFVLDYAPVIRKLGLSRFLVSRVGSEATTTQANPPAFPNTIGHVNAWPLRVAPLARRDGAIEDEGVAPNFLFSRLRRAGARVIQYNHPRAGVRGLNPLGFFNVIGCDRCANAIDQACQVDADCPMAPEPRACTCVGFQADRPLDAPPNDVLLDDDVTGASGVANPDGLRNIDFDVIEVANGLVFEDLLASRRDWFALLGQAFGITASGPIPFLPGTGVSDSHRNTIDAAGYFRTWVLGAGSRPERLDRRGFDTAVRGGRMVVSTGPWIELAVRGRKGRPHGPGDLVEARGGVVALDLRVAASPWVPVDEVRVLHNGVVVRRFDATTRPALRPAPAQRLGASRHGATRLHARFELPLARDGWLLVEAGARLDETPAPDPLVDPLVPGWFAWAFTNPVFVDAGGDGYQPPGPTPPAETARAAAKRRHPSRAASAPAHRDLPPLDRLRIPAEADRRDTAGDELALQDPFQSLLRGSDPLGRSSLCRQA